jgi:hypothetical protein
VAVLIGAAARAGIPARADVTIGASPSRIELEATPGAAGSQQITVTNTGDQPFSVAVGTAPYQGAAGNHSLVDWLRVAPTGFDLAPGQHQTVDVTISVPADAASGGRYAMVTLATGAPGADANGPAVAVSGRLGVAFLLTVKGRGKLKRAAEIERFAPFLDSDGRIGFRARLRNTGNIHLTPQGSIAVMDAGGERYGALDLPTTLSVLPDGELDMRALGSLPMPPGEQFTASTAIDYGAKKPLKATAAFDVGPPAVALTNLAVCENLDRGPTLSARLTDGGPIGVEPRVRFVVTGADGQGVEAAPETPALLWPGDTVALTADLGERLVSGDYTLSAEIAFGNAPPETVTLPFRIGGEPAGAAPLCNAA